MKIQVLSDLHIEDWDFRFSDNDADIIVLAGDIQEGGAVDWIQRNIPQKPVIYIFGNHEYYGVSYPSLLDDCKAKVRGSNIQILESETTTIDHVLFAGVTLWTDFALHESSKIGAARCQRIMNDYRNIEYSATQRKLRAPDTFSIHQESVAWLQEIRQSRGDIDKLVVITHHAPSPRSLHKSQLWRPESPAYASDLESLILSISADLWVHGHTHYANDYCVGKTRVVSNPRGYSYEQGLTGFDPYFTVTL